MIVLAFAIPAVVILGSLLLFAASRNNETRKAEGQLSKETRQRDLDAHVSDEDSSTEPAQISGQEIEKAAAKGIFPATPW